MTERFERLNIKCNFYEGVDHNDEKIKILSGKYGSSIYCMYGHINMIYDFYHNTNKPYGIFCEDDIVIHKDFKNKLVNIITEFKNLNLDILLLGYLFTEKLSYDLSNYYQYSDDLWGTQMYMLTRDNAKRLLDIYYDGISYMERNLNIDTIPLSADWTITKSGNRAVYYPLLVIEDGQNIHTDYDQNYLHHYTFVNNYIEGEYI